MHAHVESVMDVSIINKIKLPTVLSRLEMLILALCPQRFHRFAHKIILGKNGIDQC